MKQSILRYTVLAASAVASVLYGGHVQAQSADALLNKLVDKGILTSKEADDLKKDADQNFTKAYQAKSGMPDWVTAFKINGDFRARYESIYFDNPGVLDRQRFRYRLRLGMTAVMRDDFEVGVRLMSGEPVSGFSSQTGNPLSGNSTFQDNGSKKFAYVDLPSGV